jgi:transcriptional regulator with XRE-family HTH domain
MKQQFKNERRKIMVPTPAKLERVKRGMSQCDLWMQTGIPQWRISLIERGLPPKPEEARRLADALGLPMGAISPQGAENEASKAS